MVQLPYRYNLGIVCRAALFVFFVLLLCPSLRAAETAATSTAPSVLGHTVLGHTMVVIPFENLSPTPGLEWVGESFPATFHEQLNSPVLYVAARDERLRAYDRLGIPSTVHPSRATLYRLAEQMDVDYAVLGTYQYNGETLTATAQLLDMRAPSLSPPVSESESLANLGALQSALAWDLLRLVRNDFSIPKEKYIAGFTPVRLDALENYVRGMLSNSAEARVQHYSEATRLNPDYAQAWLELGKTLYAQHAYEPAIAALSQIQPSSPPTNSTPGTVVREANFYLGLAACAHGDLAKSEAAFEFVAARLPLAEVYNNLGVVAARRGQKKAAEYFERAIQNDPSDPSYHFNLAVTLSQAGSRGEAARELRTALDGGPDDPEARALLDSLTPPAGSVVLSAAVTKTTPLRIKRNYEEDAFRQMTTQMGSWAEQRFARSDPQTHARFHIELGRELLAHGFTGEAEAEFQHAATLDPGNSSPLTALAEDYEARGEFREARARAEASLRMRESAEAYLVLARLDLQENRTEAAEENVNRALQLDPGNTAGEDIKRTLAARQAQKAQP
jgi:tetratricopeptide (TPR) repeat protein